MKRILLLLLLTGYSLLNNAQGLIGSSKSTVSDSLKKEDMFYFGDKPDGEGGIILMYINFKHKDGSLKINDDFILVSSEFEMKNDKCLGEFHLYKDLLLDKLTTTFNADTTKYKSTGANEWIDKIHNLSIKITAIPQQKCFLIQYELKKE